MFSVNKKNCYITQRIGIGLKKLKNCLINRTQLIEYNRIKLYIKMLGIPKLMNNKKDINV